MCEFCTYSYRSYIRHCVLVGDREKVTQHLQGVIEHGHEFVIYRTFEHVRKDACLAIHCLLVQIERRFARDDEAARPHPKVWVHQMDGGSENSNKTFYALCALMVSVGIFDKVLVTKIITGHGHLDVDHKFGIISRASHTKKLYTPQVLLICLYYTSVNLTCHTVYIYIYIYIHIYIGILGRVRESSQER